MAKLNRLKLDLIEKTRTGTWLVKQLGLFYVTMLKWCSNNTQPTLPTINIIAELLEVDPREIITGNE